MRKLNLKNFALFVVLGILLVGLAGIRNVKAEVSEILPKGGDSFETAVEIEPGSYEKGTTESGETDYFYINVKPGQEIKIKGTFTASSKFGANPILYLYDEDKTELRGEMGAVYGTGSLTISWLPNSDKDSYKYYLQVGSDYNELSSSSLDVSITDYFDAGSQTDAGDTFKKALSIAPGEYKGYLSGENGTDAKDFYKLTAKKGEALTAKVTPESAVSLGLKIYDSNRVVLKEEYAPNKGAIVKISLVAKKNEDVFVLVYRESWGTGEDLIDYGIDITAEAGVEAPVEGEEVLPEESREGPIIGITEEGLTEEGAEKIGKAVKIGIMLVWLVPLIIGLVILIVIVIVIVVLVRKKKRSKPQ